MDGEINENLTLILIRRVNWMRLLA